MVYIGIKRGNLLYRDFKDKSQSYKPFQRETNLLCASFTNAKQARASKRSYFDDPGIRGDLVRTDPEWEKWDFVKLSEAIRLWTRRNPVDTKSNERDSGER